MEFMLNSKRSIDFVIRTNMSTVINIPELKSFCNSIPRTKVYTAGIINELRWLDFDAGVIDESLWGTKYASGTSIIMSSDVAKYMVKEKHKVRHDIIDDLSIGVFMTNYAPDNYGNAPLAKMEMVPSNLDKTKLNINSVFYRTRTNECKKRDIQNMQTVVDLVYNTTEHFHTFSTENAYTNNNDIITYSGVLLLFILSGFVTYNFFYNYRKTRK